MTDPRVTAVVFDIGGVLLDWDPRHLYRRLIADPGEMTRFLTEICTPQWHLAHDLGADTLESCRELAARHPDQADLIMAWAHHREEMIAGELEGVGVLADVAGAGVNCFALSNMEADTFAVRRERYPFFRHFHGFVISGIEHVAKPDSKIFQILLSRYDLDPGTTVFTDDNAANVAAARTAGLDAILYSTAGELRRALRARGVPIAT